MRRMILVCAALLAAVPATAQPTAWTIQPSGVTERLRSVSAVSDKVAWASGNKGTVLRTTDGGATWAALSIPGAADLDLRDVEAFDAKTAVVLSIGSGDKSRVYKTGDAGRSWTLQFTGEDPEAFYDAIAFWDRDHGLIVGDPVGGRSVVVRTSNGGRTWQRLPADRVPPALPGDGSFAASGTCLITAGPSDAWFATGGGARARVFHTADRGETWTVADTGISAGNASSGIFSLEFADLHDGIAVGGDYRQESATGDNIQVTFDGGATWTFPGATRLPGFRSAVAYVPGTNGRVLLAVGPGGSDGSKDHGRTWQPIPGGGFHALSVEPRGRAAWAVGEQGRIGKMTLR